MNGEFDLVVLVADADMEWVMRTLLEKRADSLRIRPLRFDVRRHPGRDPGVYREAHSFLRFFLGKARYALVLVDREGSGQEHRLTAEEMEVELEARLRQNGWAHRRGRPRAAAIVLDPELEVWVWSPSPHVAQVLGVTQAQLQQVRDTFAARTDGKPERPKEALYEALRLGRRPQSARIFQELAERVSLDTHERAFDRLRSTLQGWFPARNGGAEEETDEGERPSPLDA